MRSGTSTAGRGLASLAPGLANFLTHAPGLRILAKLAAGIAPRSAVCLAFARESFRHWFEQRSQAKSSWSAGFAVAGHFQ